MRSSGILREHRLEEAGLAKLHVLNFLGFRGAVDIKDQGVAGGNASASSKDRSGRLPGERVACRLAVAGRVSAEFLVRRVAYEATRISAIDRNLDDAMVKNARTRLFGSWEMNWMAYNFAHDLALPGSSGAPIGFFMYPQAETAEGRIDSLDPDNFKYEITSKETTSTNG